MIYWQGIRETHIKKTLEKQLKLNFSR